MAPGEAGLGDMVAPVLGLAAGHDAKTYPIAGMNWHEIVNDRIGGQAVTVTFCPLCGSGMAFAAEVGGKTLDFGVSGLLYNSDMLLCDRQTESLWSQLMGQAISGPLKGTRSTLPRVRIAPLDCPLFPILDYFKQILPENVLCF